MSTLLNQTAVRRFALEQARITRRPFTRVSARFVEEVEAALRTLIAGRVHSARSKKTL